MLERAASHIADSSAFDRSGSVGDYRDTSSLQRRVAAVAGVAPSLVSIRVEEGSVIITATIGVPPSAVASAVRASLAARLGTAAAASAELSSTELVVVVVSAPTVAVAPSLASSPPPSPPPSPPQQPMPPAECCDSAGGMVVCGMMACAAIYSPVCGGDGKTYSNRCSAE